MAFFDKLNDLARNIGDKTTDAIETGKLQNRINTERNLAGEELKKIGEFYYNLWLSTGEIAPEVVEACESAKSHYDAASEAQAEIERIRAENEAAKVAAAAAAAAAAQAQAVPTGGLVCNACGTANNPGTKFCCNCGGKLELPKPVSEELVCGACGAANNSGTKFCCNCGNKLELPEPPTPRLCSNCGAEIADGMRFCGECGAKSE